jgi:dihydrofolate reductase
MLVSLIAAMDRRGLIGDETGLPWHLPSDLRRFRTYTWGKPIIMGRRTFALLGKPLPGRFNIILTHDPNFSAPGGHIARSYKEALSLAEQILAQTGGDEVMIIGGGQVYAEALQRWDRFYLTVVEGQFVGTTYFPLAALLRQRWRPACEPHRHAADEKNPYPHSFHILERVWNTESRPPGLLVDDSSHGRADAGTGLAGLDLVALLERGTVER